MASSTRCRTLGCKIMVMGGGSYCPDHKCRVKDCPDAGAQCSRHYCRPRWSSCGQPVKKKGDLCSKHLCPSCRISRYDCREHFCGQDTCLEKKAVDSAFCRGHTCPVCGGSWPCKHHVCEVRRCGNPIVPSWSFCRMHSLLDILSIEGVPVDVHTENLRYFWKEGLGDENHASLQEYHAFEEKIRRHKVAKTFASVFRAINASITVSDSQKYHLTCSEYCSDGYCNCDVMPRLSDPLFHERIAVMAEEPVYRLSTTVYTTESVRDGMAWTIPTLFVDELETIWDQTEAQIQNMIRFEWIQ